MSKRTDGSIQRTRVSKCADDFLTCVGKIEIGFRVNTMCLVFVKKTFVFFDFSNIFSIMEKQKIKISISEKKL